MLGRYWEGGGDDGCPERGSNSDFEVDSCCRGVDGGLEGMHSGEQSSMLVVAASVIAVAGGSSDGGSSVSIFPEAAVASSFEVEFSAVGDYIVLVKEKTASRNNEARKADIELKNVSPPEVPQLFPRSIKEYRECFHITCSHHLPFRIRTWPH
jgi:hypothetical protein